MLTAKACDAAVPFETVFLISTVPPIEFLATMMTDLFAVKTVGHSPVVSIAMVFRREAWPARRGHSLASYCALRRSDVLCPELAVHFSQRYQALRVLTSGSFACSTMSFCQIFLDMSVVRFSTSFTAETATASWNVCTYRAATLPVSESISEQ